MVGEVGMGGRREVWGEERGYRFVAVFRSSVCVSVCVCLSLCAGGGGGGGSGAAMGAWCWLIIAVTTFFKLCIHN